LHVSDVSTGHLAFLLTLCPESRRGTLVNEADQVQRFEENLLEGREKKLSVT
jgi:hypothetical protein